MKMTISSRIHTKKIQPRTKKDDDAKNAMVWSLNERYDQALTLEPPLDSIAIDPI